MAFDLGQSLQTGIINVIFGWNLLICAIGVFAGTLIGVLPGLGPFVTISILLPWVYAAGDANSALILLTSIYYGAQYGSSTSSILLNLPGEPGSVITTIDGYALTKQNKAEMALTAAAVSSFIAGTITTVVVAIFALPLSRVALEFGPAEYTCLMVLSLTSATLLSSSNFSKSFLTLVLGILVGLIGIDVNSGVERFTFGIDALIDGVPFGILAMGLFGIAELLLHNNTTAYMSNSLHPMQISWRMIRDTSQAVIAPALRGTTIGSFLGMLPGAGLVTASFVSYAVEKRISAMPSKFGKGAIEGVAAPESANNAAAQTALIPSLSLGIPASPTMALIIAALLSLGIQPGPNLIPENPGLFWGLIISMWVGNCMLLILNLPLINIWVQILKIPHVYLTPIVVGICVAGAYFIDYSWFNVILLLIATIIGLFLKITNCDAIPLVVGFVIGPKLEEYFVRSLTISNNNWNIFLDSSISVMCVLLSIIILIVKVRKQKGLQ